MSDAVQDNGAQGTPLLNRESILSAADIQYEIVPVPEWGGSVRVKALSGAERDEFEGSLLKIRKTVRGGRRGGTDAGDEDTEVDYRNMRAKLVAKVVVDARGVRLFSESDIAALGQKSASALDRVYGVAQRLSRLTNEDVEELMGNSERTQPAATS